MLLLPVGVGEPLLVPLTVLDALHVALALMLAEAVSVALAEVLLVAVCEAVADGVTEADADADNVPDPVSEPDALTLELVVPVAVVDGDAPT